MHAWGSGDPERTNKLQGDPSGWRLHFVDFDWVVPMYASFCLGSCKYSRIGMSCRQQSGTPKSKSTKNIRWPDGSPCTRLLLCCYCGVLFRGGQKGYVNLSQETRSKKQRFTQPETRSPLGQICSVKCPLVKTRCNPTLSALRSRTWEQELTPHPAPFFAAPSPFLSNEQYQYYRWVQGVGYPKVQLRKAFATPCSIGTACKKKYLHYNTHLGYSASLY